MNNMRSYDQHFVVMDAPPAILTPHAWISESENDGKTATQIVDKTSGRPSTTDSSYLCVWGENNYHNGEAANTVIYQLRRIKTNVDNDGRKI